MDRKVNPRLLAVIIIACLLVFGFSKRLIALFDKKEPAEETSAVSEEPPWEIKEEKEPEQVEDKPGAARAGQLVFEYDEEMISVTEKDDPEQGTESVSFYRSEHGLPICTFMASYVPGFFKDIKISSKNEAEAALRNAFGADINSEWTDEEGFYVGKVLSYSRTGSQAVKTIFLVPDKDSDDRGVYNLSFSYSSISMPAEYEYYIASKALASLGITDIIPEDYMFSIYDADIRSLRIIYTNGVKGVYDENVTTSDEAAQKVEEYKDAAEAAENTEDAETDITDNQEQEDAEDIEADLSEENIEEDNASDGVETVLEYEKDEERPKEEDPDAQQTGGAD